MELANIKKSDSSQYWQESPTLLVGARLAQMYGGQLFFQIKKHIPFNPVIILLSIYLTYSNKNASAITSSKLQMHSLWLCVCVCVSV